MAAAAAADIRSRILGGDFPPGFQLRQDLLASQLGMSRIPVREALLLLEREGLLKILPHRGAIVVQLSESEVEELFNMRMLMEPFLLERSAPQLTAADYNKLKMIVAEYADAVQKQDESRWNELNTEFHMVLYSRANSPRVTDTVKNLLNECDRHTRVHLANIESDRQRAIKEHFELLRLCEEQHYRAGAAFLRDHIDHMRVALIKLFNERRGNPRGSSASSAA